MKVGFKIQVDHVVDLITNSSSELFVLKASTKEIVEEMIASVYPDYLDEYNEPQLLIHMSHQDLYEYIDDKMPWGASKDDLAKYLIPGFEFDEMFVIGEGNYRGEERWKVNPEFITEERREKICRHYDPDLNTWRLYSREDNPKWEFQEKLSEIAERYHLG